jgi:4-hydroxybenzoate polyprenyltransferase
MTITATLKGYLELSRIHNLPGVWTNVLCAALLATIDLPEELSWQQYQIPALALSCLYLAGSCFNDICGADDDSVGHPTRPIPCGTVSRCGASFFTGWLVLAASTLLIQAEAFLAFYASLLLVALMLWYDLARNGNRLSLLLIASCRLLVFVVTPLAIVGKVPQAVLLAGASQFGYALCLGLVARYEHGRATPFPYPVIPLMLAGISLLDGVIMALLVQPLWLMIGAGGSIVIWEGQKFLGGDSGRIEPAV